MQTDLSGASLRGGLAHELLLGFDPQWLLQPVLVPLRVAVAHLCWHPFSSARSVQLSRFERSTVLRKVWNERNKLFLQST